MPWSCPPCSLTHADDVAVCPSCGARKESWTLQPEKTRNLVVTRARLELLRGDDAGAVAPGATTPALGKAEVCPVLSRSALADLLARGERPGFAHRLVVRVWPRTAKDRTVVLGLDPSDRPHEDVAVPREAGAALGPDGSFDVTFVCVAGAGAPLDLSAEGLHLVDLTDGEAHVAEVEVAAVRQRATLPTERVADGAQVELLEVEDVGFPLGRAILLPDGRTGADEATGLVTIAAALEHARRNPDRLLLVAGHTDASGSASKNLTLSAARAENVRLFLAGDAAGWAAHCQAHHDPADVQRALAWVARTFGWACDPGPVDGDFGKTSKAARDAFRTRCNQERGAALATGGKQSTADWAALFGLYDEALADKLKTDPARLAGLRAGLRFATPPTLACGEAWPLLATGRPGADPTLPGADRRVDVLFLPPANLPDLAAAPPGAELYSGARWSRRWLSVDDAWREPEAPPGSDAPLAEDCALKRIHAQAAEPVTA